MSGIYRFTGNPFVDAGVSAIQEWCQKQRPEEIEIKDIQKIVDDLTTFYISDGWKKSLFSVFPNNYLTNPIVKDKKKRMEDYFNNLIEGIQPLGKTGDCIACRVGEKDCLYQGKPIYLSG